MCIICTSQKGVRQPSEATLKRMWDNNPHGAGYMVARNNRVEISKGFMTWEEFRHALRYEKFTKADSVVYHFRISTQAGVTPEMTHPFPLSHDIRHCKWLDLACDIGVAHNGIIWMTSDPTDKEYNDTAHYIAEYLTDHITEAGDLEDPQVRATILRETGSRWAFLDGTGKITTVGNFIWEDGLGFSNGSYAPRRFSFT